MKRIIAVLMLFQVCEVKLLTFAQKQERYNNLFTWKKQLMLRKAI